MERMGIQAVYRKPNTSKLAPGQKIYRYLLRIVRIRRRTPHNFSNKST